MKLSTHGTFRPTFTVPADREENAFVLKVVEELSNVSVVKSQKKTPSILFFSVPSMMELPCINCPAETITLKCTIAIESFVTRC